MIYFGVIQFNLYLYKKIDLHSVLFNIIKKFLEIQRTDYFSQTKL